MILLIDNYDSFTWNLVHLIGSLNHQVDVQRNDALSAKEAINTGADAIVLSPGPCTPDEAGICLDLVRLAAETKTPLFGVCLGLQSIAQAFGGEVVRANKLMHGKVSTLTHTNQAHLNQGFMAPLPETFTATRYHSLVAAQETMPSCLTVIARADDDGEIMAIEHETCPIAAVQFHPESIASEQGAALFQAFMSWAQKRTPIS